MSHQPSEIDYRILKLLSAQPNLSQRALADRLGISLGRTNYVLGELIKKGIIKMKRLQSAPQKNSYTYLLTPKGLREKAKITTCFLKQKLKEYDQIKDQIKEITEELETLNP